jgi:Ser/Thr protein kinase RdoA (MazF antagonist)
MAPEFSARTMRRTLVNSCEVVGLDPSEARLLRLGENAIFALAAAPIVVRIARSTHALDDVGKETRVARWLHEADYPAARLADIPEAITPIIIDEHPVTFWQYIETAPRAPTPADLGRLLRRLHELEPPSWLKLPSFNPFGRVRYRLQNPPPSVDEEAVGFLTRLFADMEPRLAELQFNFAWGAVHGDAHPGNLMRCRSGEVLLIDFEGFSYGPREWDLSMSAAYRYGFDWQDEREYRSFAEAYGYDVAKWHGFPLLRAIRELTMTTWLMQLVDTDPAINDEFHQRISDLRTGKMPRRWKAF